MTSRGHLTSGTSRLRQIYVAAEVPTGPTLYSVVSGSGAKLKTRFLDESLSYGLLLFFLSTIRSRELSYSSDPTMS
jgi:hypothetical protein